MKHILKAFVLAGALLTCQGIHVSLGNQLDFDFLSSLIKQLVHLHPDHEPSCRRGRNILAGGHFTTPAHAKVLPSDDPLIRQPSKS